MSGQVIRHRFAVVLLTAALLAALTVALTGGERADAVDGPVDVVFVATGRNFPDALAGSTLATSTNAPMLTVEKDLPIPAATIDALAALDPDRILVFGGPGAVSAEVFEALSTFARSGQVSRIAGDDRHETAAAIADALPDKVADADLLDGLDAADFLRATAADDFVHVDDAIDADAVGGLTASDLRVITLQPGGTEGAAQVVEGAIQYPSDDVGYAAWSLMAPPGWRTDVAPEVDVALRVFGAPCVARITIAGGFVIDGETQLPGPGAPYEITFDNGDERLLLRVSAGLIEAGSTFRLGLLRDGTDPDDTCGNIALDGAQIRY